jgi:regulatory protein
MKKITALRGGRSQTRINLFLDGSFAFSLPAETALTEKLQVGQELSDRQIESLTRSDGFHRCLDAAARYLGYRPRSEVELRERLHRRGFDSDTVEAVLKRLKEQALVDDAAFARFWSDNRQSFRPRSRWLSRVELRQKGVPEDIIDQVVVAIDDRDSAYRAAMNKVRSVPRIDYQDFRRRLGEYLRRRGFGYGVINHTVRRIWDEKGDIF